ncbi:MAG: hypothetical protein J6T39_00955, partial [Clostridia bacterium]|nr:hypothetical protein [Clostridia bacterium]
MVTLEEFKEKEKTLYTKLYRDILKTEISSFLTGLRESKSAETRKMATHIENYLAQLATIYGEHFAKDTIFSGEMETRNVLKRIEKSLEHMKVVDKVTGELAPKFSSLMELCKYPYQLLKENEDMPWGFNIDNATNVALAEVEPLIHEYFDHYDFKNQKFNWDGYQKTYHKVLNKFVDQAVRGNEYGSLLNSLKVLNDIETFAKNDNKYETLREIRETYNDSTGFSNKNIGKEKTGTYNINTRKVLNSLYNSQLYLAQLNRELPNGDNKLDVQNQIEYIERVISVINLTKNKSGTDLVKFFSKTDKPEMLAQFIRNMVYDWDIVANLSNNQCKKVLNHVDQHQSSTTYLALKAALGHYMREQYERYVSDEALKNSGLLAKELIGLSKFCEENSVEKILKYKHGIPDTELKTILENVQEDNSADIVDILPHDIQKQIATGMANKGFLDNRVLFNTWKYSTEQYIAIIDVIEAKSGVSENFENEHSVPKTVAMSILWE